MDRIGTAILDWALDVDDADPSTILGLSRLYASGVIVLGVGIGIVVRGYVMAGFEWPYQRTVK